MNTLKTMTRLAAFAAVATMASTAPAWADDLSHADKAFLEDAAHAGNTEIQGSKLAQTKATKSDVKSFADEMIKDHTAVGDELTALATSKGVKVSDEPGVTQKAKLKMLGMKDGADFDRQYINEVGVKAHQDTIALFKKASTNAKDPEVKAWAVKTLPSLEHHLSEAQALAASMPQKSMKSKTSS
jgi:putative membrane protein